MRTVKGWTNGVLAVAVLVLPSAPATGQNLLVNGTFEDHGPKGSDATPLDDWPSVVYPFISKYNGTTHNNIGGPVDGDNYGTIDGHVEDPNPMSGHTRQTVAVPAGPFELTGFIAAGSTDTDPSAFQAFIRVTEDAPSFALIDEFRITSLPDAGTAWMPFGLSGSSNTSNVRVEFGFDGQKTIAGAPILTTHADALVLLAEDCNNNNISDECDVDCGDPGGPCYDIPDCGQKEDCNGNGVPDECETPIVIYVDANSPGGDPPGSTYDGTTWDTALTDLQDALDAAEGGIGEIRVADGTYKPSKETDPGDPSSATFQLLNCVSILGGFAGAGAPDPDARDPDPETNNTVLSGDIGPGYTYHVVTASGTDATAILDGFGISYGFAYGSYPHNAGGGMYNDSGSPTLTNCTFSGNLSSNEGAGMWNSEGNPTLSNCTFIWNHASGFGGGMFNYHYSSPTLTNCTFAENSGGNGGGMYNYHYSSPTLTNCTFSKNSALAGGGMFNYLYSSPTLTNCTFTGNRAEDEFGGAMGGGMCNYEGSPTLTNCTFSGNWALGPGGGMYNYYGAPTLTNCTFVNNMAEFFGGGMCNDYGGPTLTNCILWGNDPDEINDCGYALVTYSCVEGGWLGAGNIDADPLFRDPYEDDSRLLPSSPCIDAGLNAAVPADTLDLDGDGDTAEPIPFDLDGDPRFFDDPSSDDCQQAPGTCGDPPVVDMGAYEYRIPPLLLTGAVSRKTHGTVGEFDIDLPLDPAAAAGVECRQGGPTQIVLTFSEDIKATDGNPDETEVRLWCPYSPCEGTVNNVDINGNTMTIDISGMPDVRCLWVELEGIADLEDNLLVGDKDVHVVVLYGDVDGDGNVTLTDYLRAKDNNAAQPPWGEVQIRCDIDLDYNITLTDYLQAKDMNGHAVTCP